MMYSPTFLSPSNSVGVDATQNIIFTWEVNATDETQSVAFQLFIRKNDDNVQVYDSTKIISSEETLTLIANTLINANDYKYLVRVYYNDTEYVESDWVLFQARLKPTITMSVPSSISSQNYTFSFLYNHLNGVNLKSYKVVLYDNELVNGIVFDTGFLFNSSVPNTTINHEITGMVSGLTYNIKVFIIDQNDMSAESELFNFTSNYSYPDNIPEFYITPIEKYGALKLEWSNLVQIIGEVEGDYSFALGKYNYSLELESGSILSFNTLIPQEFTCVYYIKLLSDFNGDLFKLDDDFSFGYDGQRYYFKNQYRITAGSPRIIPEGYFLIGVKHNKVIIVTETYTEILE